MDFITYLKYIKGCIVFHVGPLTLTLVFIQKIHFKDAHREKQLSNNTSMLSKSVNVDIWLKKIKFLKK